MPTSPRQTIAPPPFACNVELHISPRLRAAIPAMTADQRKGLEENIKRDGKIFNAIRYWHDGKQAVIVDGINRFEIATANNIPYSVEGMEFSGYDAAILWMKLHALGQRNLSEVDERRLMGEVYNATKPARGGDQRSQPPVSTDQPDTVSGWSLTSGGVTAEDIAATAGVSERTVRRAGKMVEALEKFPEAMREAIETGKHAATDTMILALAKMSSEQIATLWGDVRTGRQPGWKAAAESHGYLRPRAKTAAKTTETAAAAPPPEDPAITAATAILKKHKVQCSDEQVKAFAECDADVQDFLAVSVKEGKQTLDQAIERGAVPEMTPEEQCDCENKAIEKYCREVLKFAKDTKPDVSWIDDQGRFDCFLQKLKDGLTTLRSAKAVVCPACHGQGCSVCKVLGFIPKLKADQIGASA
jgi:hypothetical protein